MINPYIYKFYNKNTLQKNIYTLRIVLDIFFDFLLCVSVCSLMSLNSLFSSFSLFHISFSVSLGFSCFFFFLKFVFFLSYFSSFHFSFFKLPLNLFFFSLVEIVNFYWFLFKNAWFSMSIFIILGFFS